MGEIHTCDICKNPMILGDCYKCGGVGQGTNAIRLVQAHLP
jgi:hypothetical protein